MRRPGDPVGFVTRRLGGAGDPSNIVGLRLWTICMGSDTVNDFDRSLATLFWLLSFDVGQVPLFVS